MTDDTHALADRLRGRFVVFDGPDGAGKSTQRQMLADFLGAAGVDAVSCRDPGGTKIGNRIRSVLLDYDLSTMDAACETMLFMASRAQLVEEVIRPALEANQTVLCDRFVTSTCAYQGAVGFDVQRIIELARYAIDDTWPDITLVFDVDVAAGFARIGRKPGSAGRNRKAKDIGGTLFDDVLPDAMEARPIEFHRRVRERFLEVSDLYPTRVEVIDGRDSAQVVHRRVLECLEHVTF